MMNKTLTAALAAAAAMALCTAPALAATQQMDLDSMKSSDFSTGKAYSEYTAQEAYREILSWASGSTDVNYLDQLYEDIELSAFRYGWEPEFAIALISAEARYGKQISWARYEAWRVHGELTGKKQSKYPNVLSDTGQALSELTHLFNGVKDDKNISGNRLEYLVKLYWTGPDGSFNKDSEAGFYVAVSKLYNALEPYARARDLAADGGKYKSSQKSSNGSSWGGLALGDLDNYSSKLNSMPKLASQLKSFGRHDTEYAKIAKHFNKKLSDEEAIVIARAVLTYCEQTDNIVDPRLVMSLLAAESRFKPGAVSKAGAMGLGQLMPGTARSFGVKDPFDPIQNIYGCVKYLEREVVRWRDRSNYIDLVLASYNAGPGAVKKYGGVPPYKETKNYVKIVKGYYSQLAR